MRRIIRTEQTATYALPFTLSIVARGMIGCLARSIITMGVLGVLRLGAADAIYTNGTIVTLDPANRVVEAVAVRDDRIIGVGTEAEMRKLVAANPRVVDLGGHTLLPGFYAAHDHFLSGSSSALYSLDLNSPPIGTVTSVEDIVTALRERAAEVPAGQWITGRGYDDTLVREGRHPTRRDLDRASTTHPIWITHTSGHLGVANSAALKIAKIDEQSTNPANGVIQREPGTQVPNGVFEEMGGVITRHIPNRTLEERLEAARVGNATYLAKGVTTAVIAGGTPQGMATLRLAYERQLLELRLVSMISGGTRPSAAAMAEAKTNELPGRLRIGAIKLLQDGSLQGYTGYLTQPYELQPAGKQDYRGYALRSREALRKLVFDYHRAGHQLAIHGNGDAAIDDILHAFAEAQRLHPRRDARHRIEHCQTPREDQLKRMAELGISPSFFVGHVYYWGDRHRDIFLGEERAARISPLHSALREGLRFTVHNDTPVTPVDPLLLVWAAVTRVTREGKVLGPAQRIPVVAALRAVTSDAAWQNFEEKDKGSIEAGKVADFVILAENPLTLAPERLKDIPVLETIVGGRSVYRRR